MSAGLIDIHQHLLWGMDDGARSEQIMREMIRRASEQQIGYIVATPHAAPGLRPFESELYAQRLAQARVCAADYGIEVLGGAEVAWTYDTLHALGQGRVPTMNKTDYVLLELWPSVTWSEAESAVSQMLRAGFVPVLAHVERYRCFFWEPRMAATLKRRYPLVRYQINAASLLGRGGFVCRKSAKTLLRMGLADAVASDAHGCSERPIDLMEAYHILQAEYGAQEAMRLTRFGEVIL